MSYLTSYLILLKKNFHFLLIIILFNLNLPSVFCQGYKFDKNQTEKLQQFNSESFGFSGILPSSYSLRNYAPTPQTQEGSTCVGWSLGYAAMSIMYNKALGITNRHLKDFIAFDPVFTYLLAKDASKQDCEDPISLGSAINQMLKYGCKRLVMPPAFVECSESVFNNTDQFSAPFIPKDVYSVNFKKEKTLSDQIDVIKKAIVSGYPLPFGMDATKSLMGIGQTAATQSGLWTPEKSEEGIGGHAMCIIGYNDLKFGGAFEIMNSWGKNHGDNGFIWIRYSDFIKYVQEVLLLDFNPPKFGRCKIGNCTNGYSCIELTDGSTYEGALSDGRPEGYGLYVWPDKTFFAGIWSKGKRNGKGLFYHDGKLFGCTFNNDELMDSQVFNFTSKPLPGDSLIRELQSSLEKSDIQTEKSMDSQSQELLKGLQIEFK